MHKLMELKEKLMDELEDYAENGKFSKDDVEAIKYTASAIDHICNIIEDSEDEYSNAMDGGSYTYARGGRSYARGRGRNARRDAMGRYSRRDGYSKANDLVSELKELMETAPDERSKMEIRGLISKMEQM